MSFNPFDFLRAIRDDKRLSATDKSVAVLSLLSRRNSESCRCDPSLKTVCSDAGVTDPRTATRALAALEACGYIQVEKARGIRNRYLLTVPAKALSSNAPTLDVPTSNAPAFDAGEVHTSNVGGVPTSNVCRTTKRTTKELLGGADAHACDSAACPTVEDIPADVFGPDPDISNPPAELSTVKEKPAKEKTASKKGSRLNLETLPDEWAQAAKAIRPDVDPAKVFDEFRDYWIARPGAGGCKLDWLATWRNWLRKISYQDVKRMSASANAFKRSPSSSPVPEQSNFRAKSWKEIEQVRRRTEAVRSMRGSAAGVRGMAASHRSPRHSISASANRVVRTMRGMPLRSVTARASESVASDRSGVSSARVKCWMVAVMAIRF